ncbi:MAG: hypothetical protein ABSF50_23325 [Burkholderiaceae bacterium]|jgi:hypothetical protein
MKKQAIPASPQKDASTAKVVRKHIPDPKFASDLRRQLYAPGRPELEYLDREDDQILSEFKNRDCYD